MNVQDRLKKLCEKLHNSVDVTTRVFVSKDAEIGFLYLKSMTDNQLFSENIFAPISRMDGDFSTQNIINHIETNLVSVVNEDEFVEKLLSGMVLIFSSTSNDVIGVDIQDFLTRPPTEPPTSPVIMGPREGFTEDLQTNISLLRRRFRTEKLVLKDQTIGDVTQTKIVVCYLDGIADKKVVKELEKRLSKVKIDGVIDAYYLTTLLSDRPNSLLKQVGCAEKPDIVSAKMLEGRVAIIIDNSPIVLTVPFLFLEDVQNSNDYYTNYIYATFVRIIRVLGLFIAVLGPGIYIATELFHVNILPIKYLITIADATQQIPFTPFIEILFVHLLFQILYEVSLRLPSYLGLATSIVGALILGDTGVKAGLISPPTVIVVAIAKITLYAIPEQNAQINVFQFVFLILGASLGMLGIVGGMIYVFTYANTIENFDAPYLAPFTPFILSDNKDGILTVPINDMNKLPKSIKNDVEERTDA
ncbi:MAG: spore germination protein [Clostridia bacterium]|nr:spore germination protein [Clostridia bacterium]